MGKHKFLKLVAASATALYGINTWIDQSASKRNMCNTNHGKYYQWKHGDIFYTMQGTGNPILLIHNMDQLSSHYEWSKLIKRLSRDHIVYTIDLIGCGQSDKPGLTYTNYLFVQLITDFVKEVIHEKTDVITSGDSASCVIMANHMDQELFNHIILINPNDIKKTSMEPSRLKMLEKEILFLPLVGTALYNYYMSEDHIRKIFLDEYLYQTTGDFTRLLDTYYQTSHIHKSRGRYLYASKKCCYLNVNVEHALRDKTNISILSANERKDSMKISEEYTRINDNINITNLSHCKLLPQLEVPEKTLEVIEQYLK